MSAVAASPSQGKQLVTALFVAELLREGYDAKVQGGEPLTPQSFVTIFVDDLEVERRSVARVAQPGLLLVAGTRRVLVATATREDAVTLWERALRELEQ